MLLPIVYLLLAAAGALLYLYQRHQLGHWRRYGFPHLPARHGALGHLLDVVLRRCSFGVHMYNLHRATASEHPLLCGLHFFLRPALLVKDAGLVRRILATDFASFYDRGTFSDPQRDPLSGHMFNLRGAEWRRMRARLTPTFTSGKLRAMMPAILQQGELLKRHLRGAAQRREVVAFKHLLDRYALNIMANVGFGLDVDTIAEPEHEFTRIERVINGSGVVRSLRLVLAFLCPWPLYALRTWAIGPEALAYFRALCGETFAFRERNGVQRKDFMQLLLQLRKTGSVRADDDGDWGVDAAKAAGADATRAAPMTLDECAAQAFLFYLAGFDTSASALAYALYELVRNPAVLKQLQREIDETLERNGGEITYEAIQEMAYLEQCILESVRKYPTLPILNRQCTVDYPVPGTDLVIPAGTPVVISVLGLGRDERYFPQPERFMPERFAPDTRQYDEAAFVAFGEGPRMCVGLRLGKMIAKIGLVQLLRSYDFECVSDREIEFDNFSVTLVPKGGVEIRVVERQ